MHVAVKYFTLSPFSLSSFHSSVFKDMSVFLNKFFHSTVFAPFRHLYAYVSMFKSPGPTGKIFWFCYRNSVKQNLAALHSSVHVQYCRSSVA